MRPFSKWCLNHNVSTLDDLCTAGLDDFHDVPQGALGDAGVVVAQIALASFGDPNFRGVSPRTRGRG